MNGFQRVCHSEQSLWLNNVTRRSLQDGGLRRHLKVWSITGVAINPSTVLESLNSNHLYASDIERNLGDGVYGEALARELIVEDVRFAADQLRHVYERTSGVDGWVTLPIWPLSVDNIEMLPKVVAEMYSQLKRPNVLITIPGCDHMLAAIEEITSAGIPLNTGPVFTPHHLIKVTEAYLKGIEKRIAQGLVPSVCFVSGCITKTVTACREELVEEQAIHATILLSKEMYKVLRRIHASQRWERAYIKGVRPLRLVWSAQDGVLENGVEEMIFSQLIAPFAIMSLSEEGMQRYLNINEPLQLVTDDDQTLKSRVEAILNKKSENLQEGEVGRRVRKWIDFLDTVARKSAEVMQMKKEF
ncbi:transaldolase family protein [Desulfogranum marinum]|uniref:transaldolase family protein n=1 Tax=Desulfogranum marinum TaxID=453220 RepID=UPI0029C942D2|nr:transaldolase family protein [Desulfogranum marinum]